MKLPTVQLSPLSCYFSPLRSRGKASEIWVLAKPNLACGAPTVHKGSNGSEVLSERASECGSRFAV
jgi:hypothetical protein